MKLKYKFIKSKKEQKNILLLLHGYGSSSNDLSNLVDLFDELDNTSFVIPDGIIKLENIDGYSWFPLFFSEYEVSIKDIKDVFHASEIIDKFIQQIITEYKIKEKDIGIWGFSQGGILALCNALYSSLDLRAIVCHSGLFYFENNLIKIPTKKDQNILIIHGENDSVINIQQFHKTIDFFNKNKIKFESFAKNNLDHSIDNDTISKTQEFFIKNMY